MRRVARAVVPIAMLSVSAFRPSPAGAQAPVTTWTLEEVAERFCVSYLVEPERAARLVGQGFVPVAAERFEGLHPAVAQLIEAEAQYRTWIPGEICLLDAARLTSGTRSVSEAGRPITLGYSGFSAMPAGGGTAGMRGMLFSTSGALRRLATDQLIHVEGVSYERGKVPEGTDERRVLKFAGATLTWEGRLLDPVAAPEPRRSVLAVEGKRNRRLAVAIGVAAEWTRPAVGNFRVQGKSDLAEALIGSPIRMFGPATGGGTTTFEFGRR